MLVLTRKVGEQILIGEDIAVTVISIRGGQIRLGIAAPQDVVIRREELAPLPRNARERHEVNDISRNAERLVAAGS